MSIRYLQNVLSDTDYYINKCYDTKALLKISCDIKAARKELDELEMLIYNQYQCANLVIKYNEVRVRREKRYNDKVEIFVAVYEQYTLNGEKLDKSDFIYNTHKKFTGNEKKAAKEYAGKLQNDFKCPVIFINWK